MEVDHIREVPGRYHAVAVFIIETSVEESHEVHFLKRKLVNCFVVLKGLVPLR